MRLLYKKYICLLLAVFPLTACSTTSELPKRGNHFLWKIESDNSVVYLLGSIHLAKPELYPLDSVIEKAYEQSDAIAVELNVKKVNAMDMMKKAMYNDNTTLKDHLKPEIYKLLKDIFEKMNFPPLVYERMKPWMAVQAAMISTMHDSGYSELSGLDIHFLNRADSANKEILELESLQLQLSLFDELETNADAFVKYSLEDMNNSMKQVEEMFSAWKTGDAKRMEAIITTESGKDNEFSSITEKMIDNRNIGMTEKIEGYLKTIRNYFVIVGAGHIVGDKGIISILTKKKKYKIGQM